VETLFTASTHDYILFFTNQGRAYRKKGYLIPEAGRQAKGTNIVNILPLQPGERVQAMIRLAEFEEEEESYLVFVTRNGTAKRMYLNALRNIRNVGIRAISLDEGDELISVRHTDGTCKILIATHDGMAICFDENDLRPMGRNAAGVRGIRLREGDYCVGAACTNGEGMVLTVTENGYGKRTPVEEYLRGGEDAEERIAQNRGGLGLKNYNITEKTGKVADVRIVSDSDDILVITDDGTIIRMAAEEISVYSRATQGVRLMRIGEEARVISVAITEKEEDEESPEEPEDEGSPDEPENVDNEETAPQSDE
jgi:DNA gyrase subunit A